MNKIMIEKLEKLNDYPFRVFELETRDGRRIRLTRHYTTLYGEHQKANGDIQVEQDTLVAFLRYDDLEDVIYFVPPWKRPFSWIHEHPEWIAVPLMFLISGIGIGLVLAAHWK
jgi:hypothetical protein